MVMREGGDKRKDRHGVREREETRGRIGMV